MLEAGATAYHIHTYRKENHEIQEVFADNCGISTEEVSLLERKQANPKLSTLQIIAAYIGNTVAELLTASYI